MGRSAAWDDIQPAMQSHHQSIHTQKYLALPDKIVDILIDASEQYFIGKPYKLTDIEKYCKKYLKDHKYTFVGNDFVLAKVVSYFRENRTHIANAREQYTDLLIDSEVDIGSLPGGVCSKVAYLIRLAQVTEHYEKNRDRIIP
jgi:pyruvate/oxaloacetate carboxyltransferase